jgi:hypothetical protein
MTVKNSSKSAFSCNSVDLIFVVRVTELNIITCSTDFSIVHLIRNATALVGFCLNGFVKYEWFSCVYFKSFFITWLFLCKFGVHLHIFGSIWLYFLIFLNSKGRSIIYFFNLLACIICLCVQSS